jgi:periplasmic copper chaperone A
MTALRRIAFVLTACLAYLPAGQAAEPVAASPTVRDAWARATAPGTGVAAVYCAIVGGSKDDRLIGASTDRAEVTQIHSVMHAAGMARMRPLDEVVIPARKTVVLAPETMHLMLMNLSQPLTTGEHFVVQLRFARAGTVEVAVDVRPPDASGPVAR